MSALLQSLTVEPTGFTPGVQGRDVLANYWLAQATLRLRREVCWLWRERGQQVSSEALANASLPPNADRAQVSLDLQRYERDKRQFMSHDATARHLGERLAAMPMPPRQGARGSFGWVAAKLDLSAAECFVFALGLLSAADSAAGPVIACCQNDASRTQPTLALAQRLWEPPDEILQRIGPAHPLWAHGLLSGSASAGGADWHAPFGVPALLARELLFAPLPLSSALVRPEAAQLPQALATTEIARVAAALASGERSVLPMFAPPGADLARLAAALVGAAGGILVRPNPALSQEQWAQAASLAWLRGEALFIDASELVENGVHDPSPRPLPLPGLPLTIVLGSVDRALLHRAGQTLPAIAVPALSYAERLCCWRAALGDAALAPSLPELARRYRYEAPAIERVGRELARLGHTPSPAELFATARADLDVGTLAQPVTPRFVRDELMLPPALSRQIDEIVLAMRNLTRTHHEWGTARPWNEGGLTALFAGPPGTGKTMAAEVLARELDLLLFRIDLSQVVNKYIGETEKNLARLFDAADTSDVILFFDEADSLFGKRTEVKDAHDRYANLEISYLLERMERFKGLAILATNRKKDLDEAFLRRLRFVLEFPMPGPAERLRIWRSVIPAGVDASQLDFDFLAQRFPLAGGHLRAIVFQACLQSASEGAPRALEMSAIVRAVQREYDKLDRASSLDQFGPYAAMVAAERNPK